MSEDLHREARRKQRDAARTHAKENALSKDEHSELSLWASFKKWNRIFWFSMGLSSTILLYGYDYVIIATVSAMPSFQYDFGEIYDGQPIIPSLWLGLWSFISPAASMPGAIFGGWVQDRIGRRWAMVFGTVLSAIGVAICYVSDLPDDVNARRGTFLGGKALLGGAIGMIMTICQTYMSEVLPPRLRGSLLAFFPIFTLLGQLIGSGVIFATIDDDNGHRIAFASQWAFAALPLIISFVIPESPTYLVRKGRIDEATKAQQRLDPKNDEIEHTIAAIEANIEHERQQTGATYLDCFKRVHLRRTNIILFANCMPQFFGITLIAQASYFAQILGMPPNYSILVLLLGIVIGLFANIASMWIMLRFGRRNLIVGSFAVLTGLWIVFGIGGTLARDTVSLNSICAVFMIAVTTVASLTCWPASFAVSSETSTLHLRGKTQGLGWMFSGAVSAIFGFVLPYLYNPDQANMRAKIGFVFAGLCLLAWALSWLWIPEMKGRTPAEIDRMFELKLPTRAFKTWQPDETDREVLAGKESHTSV